MVPKDFSPPKYVNGISREVLANQRLGGIWQERLHKREDPMKASSFGGSSVKRKVISVSRTAGRSQRPRVSHRSRGLSPMKVDLGVGGCVKRDGGSLRHEWGVVRGGPNFETAVSWAVTARGFGVGSSSEASVCGRGALRSRHGSDGFGWRNELGQLCSM